MSKLQNLLPLIALAAACSQDGFTLRYASRDGEADRLAKLQMVRVIEPDDDVVEEEPSLVAEQLYAYCNEQILAGSGGPTCQNVPVSLTYICLAHKLLEAASIRSHEI